MIRSAFARIFAALAITVAFAIPAQAQQIAPAQAAALKSVCAADQACSGLMAAANDTAVAAWFNTVDAAYWVWRNDVTVAECNDVIVWTEVDALSVGKARIWEWMRSMEVLDARRPNVRQGLSDAFSGSVSTRAALLALSKRTATRAEKALATGAGTNGSPSVMTWVGPLSPADASLVRVA